MPLDALIALTALTMPPDTALEPPPCRAESLRTVAIALELMDEQEARWYFRWPSELLSDLRSMRGRYAELRDAPPLCDCMRFPREDFCYEMRRQNEQYRKWLEARIGLDSTEDWVDEALEETARLWRVWDAVLDTQRAYYSVYGRRKALSDLRDMIGPVAYYGGFVPGPVPAWRCFRND